MESGWTVRGCVFSGARRGLRLVGNARWEVPLGCAFDIATVCVSKLQSMLVFNRTDVVWLVSSLGPVPSASKET